MSERKLWFEGKTGDDIDFYAETDSDNVIYNLHEDCLCLQERVTELEKFVARVVNARGADHSYHHQLANEGEELLK